MPLLSGSVKTAAGGSATAPSTQPPAATPAAADAKEPTAAQSAPAAAPNSPEYVCVPSVQSSWGDTPQQPPANPPDATAAALAAGWSVIGSPLLLPRGADTAADDDATARGDSSSGKGKADHKIDAEDDADDAGDCAGDSDAGAGDDAADAHDDAAGDDAADEDGDEGEAEPYDGKDGDEDDGEGDGEGDEDAASAEDGADGDTAAGAADDAPKSGADGAEAGGKPNACETEGEGEWTGPGADSDGDDGVDVAAALEATNADAAADTMDGEAKSTGAERAEPEPEKVPSASQSAEQPQVIAPEPPAVAWGVSDASARKTSTILQRLAADYDRKQAAAASPSSQPLHCGEPTVDAVDSTIAKPDRVFSAQPVPPEVPVPESEREASISDGDDDSVETLCASLRKALGNPRVLEAARKQLLREPERVEDIADVAQEILAVALPPSFAVDAAAEADAPPEAVPEPPDASETPPEAVPEPSANGEESKETPTPQPPPKPIGPAAAASSDATPTQMQPPVKPDGGAAAPTTAEAEGTAPKKIGALGFLKLWAVILLISCAITIGQLQDNAAVMRQELDGVKSWTSRANATLALHGIDLNSAASLGIASAPSMRVIDAQQIRRAVTSDEIIRILHDRLQNRTPRPVAKECESDPKCKVNEWFWTKWFGKHMRVDFATASKWAKTFARERVTERHLKTLAVKDLLALGLSAPQAQEFRRASGASRDARDADPLPSDGSAAHNSAGGGAASYAARAHSRGLEALRAVARGAAWTAENGAAAVHYSVQTLHSLLRSAGESAQSLAQTARRRLWCFAQPRSRTAMYAACA